MRSLHCSPRYYIIKNPFTTNTEDGSSKQNYNQFDVHTLAFLGIWYRYSKNRRFFFEMQLWINWFRSVGNYKWIWNTALSTLNFIPQHFFTNDIFEEKWKRVLFENVCCHNCISQLLMINGIVAAFTRCTQLAQRHEKFVLCFAMLIDNRFLKRNFF